MGDTTTYKVETVYQIKDETSRALKEIEKAAKDSAKATEGLKAMLLGLGAAAIGSRTFGELKSIFFDYNSALEQHQTVLAGVTSMYTGADLDKAWDRAAISLKRYTDMSWESGVAVTDLMQAATKVQGPLLQAGLSISEIEKLTHGAIKTAEAFGESGVGLAERMEKAISMGKARDPFLRMLLAQKEVHVSPEKFKKMSEEDRAKTFQKVFESKSLNALIEKQSNETLEGAVGDAITHLKTAVGEGLKPMFKEISKEIIHWRDWIEKNRDQVERIAKVAGEKIVGAFRFLKDVFKFIYDHSDTFITIAKAYAAIKIGNMVGNAVGGTLQNVAGLLTSLKEAGGSKAGGANAGQVGSALGIGVAIGDMLNKAGLETWLNEYVTQVKTVNGVVYDMSDRTTRKYVQLIESMNSFDKSVAGARDRMDKLGDKGATTSNVSAYYEGTRKNLEAQARAIDAAMNPHKNKYSGEQRLGGSFLASRADLAKSGLFDDTEIDRILANPKKYKSKLEDRSKFLSARQSSEEKAVDAAWKSLPKEMKSVLDQQMFANKAMEKLNQDKKQQGKTEVTIDPELLKSILAALGADDIDKPFKGAKPPSQTVNITIQRVTAKDPNRWLAEMDDMVARRTRAPTRAKKAWKTSPR